MCSSDLLVADICEMNWCAPRSLSFGAEGRMRTSTCGMSGVVVSIDACREDKRATLLSATGLEAGVTLMHSLFAASVVDRDSAELCSIVIPLPPGGRGRDDMIRLLYVS